MLYKDLLSGLSALPGNLSVWLEDVSSGQTVCHRPDEDHIAASVIKLGVLLAAFEAFETGALDPGQLYSVKPEDKVPSCGALTYLHDGLMVTHADLAVLMIILSDNTATNILADILGIGYVNGVLERYGLSGMCLRRKMFDGEAAARGLKNTVTARACALFFRRLLKGELVSPDASRKMLSILSDQRLNGKIPFYLHGQGIRVAHKTGEDDGVSHDAGVIFSDRPVIVVFLGNDTDVPAFERYMQDTARLLV